MSRPPRFAIALVALVVVACGAEATVPEGEGRQGVRGTVLFGPVCPVVTEASPCPDMPLPGVTIRVLEDGRPLDVRTTSDASGRFELRLPPGEYTLEPVVPPEGPGMFAKPLDVTVPDGEFVHVNLLVDSGIR